MPEFQKNSGIPTWGKTVRTFAEKIGYPSHRLTTDEYIRIPQYFYGIDRSKDYEEYYKILLKSVTLEVKPNIINNLIAEIHPKHIVTTNYDKLMDMAADNYEIITTDRELLKLNITM